MVGSREAWVEGWGPSCGPGTDVTVSKYRVLRHLGCASRPCHPSFPILAHHTSEPP